VNEKHIDVGLPVRSRRNGQQWLAVVGVCAALAVVRPCYASDAADKAAAEALFQAGKALMERGEYSDACEKFRASQDLDAGLGTLLYLADCYEKTGRTASAWATFEEAASVAASRSDTIRHEIARGRAADIKPRLSYVLIRAATPPPEGAVVTRDGRHVPSSIWGVPVPVDPGPMTIQVSAPGYQTARFDLSIPPQTPAPIEVVLPALVEEANTASVPPPADASGAQITHPTPARADDIAPVHSPSSTAEASSQQTIGVVLGGVGIVALGVAAAFTVSGYSDYKSSLKDCSRTDENACGIEGKALRDDARSSLDVATIVGSVGAAVLGTGIVLYVSAPASPGATGAEALLTRGVGLGYQGVW